MNLSGIDTTQYKIFEGDHILSENSDDNKNIIVKGMALAGKLGKVIVRDSILNHVKGMLEVHLTSTAASVVDSYGAVMWSGWHENCSYSLKPLIYANESISLTNIKAKYVKCFKGKVQIINGSADLVVAGTNITLKNTKAIDCEASKGYLEAQNSTLKNVKARFGATLVDSIAEEVLVEHGALHVTWNKSESYQFLSLEAEAGVELDGVTARFVSVANHSAKLKNSKITGEVACKQEFSSQNSRIEKLFLQVDSKMPGKITLHESSIKSLIIVKIKPRKNTASFFSFSISEPCRQSRLSG